MARAGRHRSMACRPFLGEIVLRDPLQGAHDLAVDDPRGERIELPGDRGDGRFLEEHQALLDLACQDEAPCLRHPPDGRRGRVTLRTDLDRPPWPTRGPSRSRPTSKRS